MRRAQPAAECGFGYRTSIFKHSDRYVVLAVDFRLTRSPLSAPVRYAELARALGRRRSGDRAPLAEVREAVLALRAGKGMVLDAGRPGHLLGRLVLHQPGARPAALRGAARARRRGSGEPPAWPGADGTVKVSAAWLIERAGFAKGYAAAGRGGDLRASTPWR